MRTTRDRILDAADSVLRTDGFAHATTKAIAREAGFSEATLYKHFADKAAIFVAVLAERLPPLGRELGALTERAGTSTVQANLAKMARVALDFYLESFPISVSIFSSRALLETHVARMHEMGAGPDKPLAGVVHYLAVERDLGRIPADRDLDAAAALLLGACFQRAFLVQFADRPTSKRQLDRWAAQYAATVMAALT